MGLLVTYTRPELNRSMIKSISDDIQSYRTLKECFYAAPLCQERMDGFHFLACKEYEKRKYDEQQSEGLLSEEVGKIFNESPFWGEIRDNLQRVISNAESEFMYDYKFRFHRKKDGVVDISLTPKVKGVTQLSTRYDELHRRYVDYKTRKESESGKYSKEICTCVEENFKEFNGFKEEYADSLRGERPDVWVVHRKAGQNCQRALELFEAVEKLFENMDEIMRSYERKRVENRKKYERKCRKLKQLKERNVATDVSSPVLVPSEINSSVLPKTAGQLARPLEDGAGKNGDRQKSVADFWKACVTKYKADKQYAIDEKKN